GGQGGRRPRRRPHNPVDGDVRGRAGGTRTSVGQEQRCDHRGSATLTEEVSRVLRSAAGSLRQKGSAAPVCHVAATSVSAKAPGASTHCWISLKPERPSIETISSARYL